MTTASWTDISYDGKEMRKLTRRLYKNLDAATKAKNPDWDNIFKRMEAVSRISVRHAKLIELADVMPRIQNLEKIVSVIPPHILAEAKIRAGV